MLNQIFFSDQTNWRIEEHERNKRYVITPAVDAAIDKIQRYGNAVIVGLPGEGKTELGLEILRHFRDNFKMAAAMVHKPSEWRNMIRSKRKCIILIDDMFGSEFFESAQFEKWRRYLDDLALFSGFNRRNLQNVFLVITSRKNILEEAQNVIPKLKFKDNNFLHETFHVDLSADYRLQKAYKREMIYNFLKGQNPNLLSKRDINKIISVETPLGFPYICKLFFSRQKFFDMGRNFFENPSEVLEDHINDLYQISRDSLLTLSAVLLSEDSQLDLKILSRLSNRKKTLGVVEELSSVLGYRESEDISPQSSSTKLNI